MQTGEGMQSLAWIEVIGSLDLGSHWPEPGVEGRNSGRETQGRADRDRGL